jgi:hypothetical protein
MGLGLGSSTESGSHPAGGVDSTSLSLEGVVSYASALYTPIGAPLVWGENV